MVIINLFPDKTKLGILQVVLLREFCEFLWKMVKGGSYKNECERLYIPLYTTWTLDTSMRTSKISPLKHGF